ncbi:hypothetical protein [Lichenifustis flavocetrariae]|uniref:Uncharacterized protein n=1 Tax=Lichenifustis flavocetrariae TaxID=2949735 RepID=A0AA42CM97_9HYPH|nr:hypothetical protein [Lichenifustis flavocetrariae]MCW6511326.1 hypothetical protein [Lichenifustis flavocetrariae]
MNSDIINIDPIPGSLYSFEIRGSQTELFVAYHGISNQIPIIVIIPLRYSISDGYFPSIALYVHEKLFPNGNKNQAKFFNVQNLPGVPSRVLEYSHSTDMKPEFLDNDTASSKLRDVLPEEVLVNWRPPAYFKDLRS